MQNPTGQQLFEDLTPGAMQKVLRELQLHQIELEATKKNMIDIHAELEREKARSFDLYNFAPIGFCILGENGLLKEANLTLINFLNTTSSQITTIAFSNFIHQDDQDLFFQHQSKLLNALTQVKDKSAIQKAEFSIDLRMVKGNGAFFWATLIGLLIKNQESGEIEQKLFITDISEQKATEEELSKQSELLELTGEMAKVGGWELDLSTMKVTWSKETGRLHEVDEDYQAPLLDTGENWYPPEAWPQVKAAVFAAIEKGTPYDLESPFITAKGRHIWVRIQGFPVRVDGKTVKLRGTFQDITSRRAADRDLIKSEQRLALALQGSGDGLWDWDTVTNAVYYSPQWEALFGFEPGTVEQTLATMTPRLHPDDVAGLFEEVQRFLNHDIPTYSKEARMIHKSGRIMHTLHRATALFDQDGKPTRMLGTTTDITDRKQAEIDLQTAMRGTQSAALAKTEFLTSMSHEIRTPMNGVLGLTQLLEETPLNPEQKDLVQTIKISGNLLLTLLNDILDFSKMESGKLEFECLPFDPKAMLEEIQKSMAVAVKSQGIFFRINASDSVPTLLLSDPSRLRQVIFNLVGNAIKFTTEGGVTLSLEWSNNVLKISVQDTGMGIPLDKQDLIFQRFTQADSSTARKYGGSGLGLAISRRLVEKMGGKIGLISQVGQGSTFWFSIPMERVEVELEKNFFQPKFSQNDLAEIGGAPDFSQARILLVEDNEVNQKVAGGMLKKFGCPYELAQNGKEALEKALQNSYSLILMDCEMPEMDGYAATREIRRLEAEDLDAKGNPKIHRLIVAVTANAMSDDEARCLASGMDSFLSKPLKKESLRSAIVNSMKTM